MKTEITINLSRINPADKKLVQTDSFCVAFAYYMKEKKIGVRKLSNITGVSVKTISRYRDNSEKEYYDIKCVVALCIGLHLYIKRSLQLINLAGLSLRPTAEQGMYYDFLNYAYCSNLTVEKCNEYLEQSGIEPLINTNKDNT